MKKHAENVLSPNNKTRPFFKRKHAHTRVGQKKNTLKKLNENNSTSDKINSFPLKKLAF